MTHERTERTEAVPTVDERDRRTFLKILGLTGGAGVAGEFSLDDLRGAVGEKSSAELATVGEQIRADLGGALDGERLAAAVSGVEASIAELPSLRAAGFPSEPDSAGYQEATEPAWDAYRHLAEVGFFESAESRLPEFTADHVRSTATELIRAEPLTATLAAAGLDERERTAVVVDAVNRNDRLVEWVSTESLPANPDEYDVDDVAPLHQRALGGALLWIDELDQQLWQREVLLTEEMLDRGVWDVKRMLAGTHLFAAAARDLAGPEELTDSQLSAALAAGSAIAIRGQEAIEEDVYRITDEKRAPRGGD